MSCCILRLNHWIRDIYNFQWDWFIQKSVLIWYFSVVHCFHMWVFHCCLEFVSNCIEFDWFMDYDSFFFAIWLDFPSIWLTHYIRNLAWFSGFSVISYLYTHRRLAAGINALIYWYHTKNVLFFVSLQPCDALFLSLSVPYGFVVALPMWPNSQIMMSLRVN